MTLVRAWLGVHRWRPAAAILAIAAIIAFWFGAVVIDDVGIRHINPVSVGLLIPVIAGIGGALACTGPPRILQSPARVRLARCAWAVVTTCAAVLAALPAMAASVGSERMSSPAIVRSVLITSALALAVVACRADDFLWLPPIFLTLCAMQFGGEADYAWWAASINPHVTAESMMIVIALWVAAAAGYAFAPRR